MSFVEEEKRRKERSAEQTGQNEEEEKRRTPRTQAPAKRRAQALTRRHCSVHWVAAGRSRVQRLAWCTWEEKGGSTLGLVMPGQGRRGGREYSRPRYDGKRREEGEEGRKRGEREGKKREELSEIRKRGRPRARGVAEGRGKRRQRVTRTREPVRATRWMER
mgnify:CR=1 FL=1